MTTLATPSARLRSESSWWLCRHSQLTTPDSLRWLRLPLCDRHSGDHRFLALRWFLPVRSKSLQLVGRELLGQHGQVLRDNRPLALSPKAVAVLWVLVSRAGQVVSKDELFAEVWPETVVSEGVLTNCINQLRQALGDAATRPRYIETVSRRGYRFIEKVVSSQ